MRRHHPIVRVTHWVNVLALTIMVGSGLRIFNAHPAFARIGEHFCCNPWEGMAIPGWLTFGGWLAGARNWHFAMMWLLVVNGLVYLGFIWLHGEWRDLVPRRGDPRDAWEMIKFYTFARPDHPRQGKHNTLQKLAYFSMPLVGILAVLTGIAIWKPVQLSPLTMLFGGYVWARYFHFLAMLALVVLTFGHVFMVLSVDPYSLRSMITGGYDPALSPEERNARPFLHLTPGRRRRRNGAADRTGSGPDKAAAAAAGGAATTIAGANGSSPGPAPASGRDAGAGVAGPAAEPASKPGREAAARAAEAPGVPRVAPSPAAEPAPEPGHEAAARAAEAPGVPRVARSPAEPALPGGVAGRGLAPDAVAPAVPERPERDS